MRPVKQEIESEPEVDDNEQEPAEPAEELTEEPPEEPTKEPTEEPAEEPAEEPTEEPTEDAEAEEEPPAEAWQREIKGIDMRGRDRLGGDYMNFIIKTLYTSIKSFLICTDPDFLGPRLLIRQAL